MSEIIYTTYQPQNQSKTAPDIFRKSQKISGQSKKFLEKNFQKITFIEFSRRILSKKDGIAKASVKTSSSYPPPFCHHAPLLASLIFFVHMIHGKNLKIFFQARGLRPVANDGEFCTLSCAGVSSRLLEYFFSYFDLKIPIYKLKNENFFSGVLSKSQKIEISGWANMTPPPR